MCKVQSTQYTCRHVLETRLSRCGGYKGYKLPGNVVHEAHCSGRHYIEIKSHQICAYCLLVDERAKADETIQTARQYCEHQALLDDARREYRKTCRRVYNRCLKLGKKMEAGYAKPLAKVWKRRKSPLSRDFREVKAEDISA